MTISTVPTKTLKDFINGQGYGIAPSAVVAICEELLAVREAQSVPVAWTDAEELRDIEKYKCAHLFKIDPDNPYHDKRRQLMLYTAPPAPAAAVSDERDSFECFVAQRFGKSVDQRRAKNGDNEYMAWDMAMAWTVWQGRAAMLV